MSLVESNLLRRGTGKGMNDDGCLNNEKAGSVLETTRQQG
jgi:hypothetical protein